MTASDELTSARQRIAAAYDPCLLEDAGHRLADLLAANLARAERSGGPVLPWVEPPGVTEVPCMEDYAIGGVPEEQYPERLELVQAEYGHLLADLNGEGVVIFASHYSAMLTTWAQTQRLFEEIIAWLGEQGVGEWVTFGEWVKTEGL